MSSSAISGSTSSTFSLKSFLLSRDSTSAYLNELSIIDDDLKNLKNYARQLNTLWLQSNRLTSSVFPFIRPCFRLQVLMLSNNSITHLSPSLSRVKYLHTLFLDNNLISNLTDVISCLKPLGFLENLNFSRNPLVNEPNYLNLLTTSLPSLQFLDLHQVFRSEAQSGRANVAFGKTLSPDELQLSMTLRTQKVDPLADSSCVKLLKTKDTKEKQDEVIVEEHDLQNPIVVPIPKELNFLKKPEVKRTESSNSNDSCNFVFKTGEIHVTM
ncbi:hypothetical protein GEMRC1_008501 [Eukaryota sp. GEM-RC1]